MKLGIVIPCYNEEEGLAETSRRLQQLLDEMIAAGEIDKESFVCYVDDGSKDNTWQLIELFQKESSLFRGIKLSRNFGHQNALIAGLMQLKDQADALVSMDADLQDDISIVREFVKKYKEGYDVVYGVREDRSKDTGFKRRTAEFFYRFQHFMGIETVHNHADYRLLSHKALDALAQFKEVDLFLRGIVPLLGFRSCSVHYTRAERFAGETKYPLKKMILFALDGIASFSIMPLRLITIVGFILFVVSLLAIVWIALEKLFFDNTVQGWASTMISIYLIGGIQIMSLGIIGEYVGRNFQQSKERPRYIIDKEI
ncbi:glycosyltransferase family 2 protein [Sulfurovum riftiae]|uniref:Glycosyltransferase n=1 Tax=Sulfurovum riftiae TaxID=1630136 RepID=A0A151CDC3_9BACT|nr:glycosyltransferase family 2 protein [Sulfurovum riftiae]KYJ85469.1 glycosyltransferase [Sulfurovum riftiae]